MEKRNVKKNLTLASDVINLFKNSTNSKSKLLLISYGLCTLNKNILHDKDFRCDLVLFKLIKLDEYHFFFKTSM
jgi:hypothetical protein